MLAVPISSICFSYMRQVCYELVNLLIGFFQILMNVCITWTTVITMLAAAIITDHFLVFVRLDTLEMAPIVKVCLKLQAHSSCDLAQFEIFATSSMHATPIKNILHYNFNFEKVKPANLIKPNYVILKGYLIMLC